MVHSAGTRLRDALAQYFADNGFGEDGGYGKAWVDFKIGPIPYPFPNTQARVRAVRYHDLHHIVTGYDTSFLGELDISAWEVGSGCADMVAAWLLDLGGLGFGLFAAPRRMWRAYLLGRRTRNLYRTPYDDALLDTTVDDARRDLGLAPSPPLRPTIADGVGFAAMSALGLVVGAALFVVLTPLALLAVGPLHLMARRAGRT